MYDLAHEQKILFNYHQSSSYTFIIVVVSLAVATSTLAMGVSTLMHSFYLIDQKFIEISMIPNETYH